MALGPNRSHFLIPSHGVTGCGSFHRKLPTGGATNGTPLYICTSPAALVTPEIRPASVDTIPKSPDTGHPTCQPARTTQTRNVRPKGKLFFIRKTFYCLTYKQI